MHNQSTAVFLTFEAMDGIGYLALFAASFLSATVIPFSSEAVLAATLLSGGDPLLCLILATIGNTLGGMTGYVLGRWGSRALSEKRSVLSDERRKRWMDRIKRHGGVAALGCWLPGVGDFIAVALGALRVKWLPTLFWMTLGKAARYAIVLGIVPFSAQCALPTDANVHAETQTDTVGLTEESGSVVVIVV